jgi:tetratricopeptide (TPR) repeat protein
VPLLVFPRNTRIAEPRPTFRWTAVGGTTVYHLEVVHAISGAQWYTETAATELTYPPEVPALEPDVTYLVEVSAEPSAAQEDERTWFALLGKGARDELMTAVEAIRVGGVSPPTERYLLGQLYDDYQLWGAAIDELETLAASEPQASLYQQLGDLYFQTGLYSFAKDRYQAALDAATAAGDRTGEAAAYVGLGRVADAYGQYAEAITHLERAEALYRELGDTKRVEAVTAALEKVRAKMWAR